MKKGWWRVIAWKKLGSRAEGKILILPQSLFENLLRAPILGLRSLQDAPTLACAGRVAGGQHAVRIPRSTSTYHSYGGAGNAGDMSPACGTTPACQPVCAPQGVAPRAKLETLTTVFKQALSTPVLYLSFLSHSPPPYSLP
jgi:hypothetical protein